MKCMHTRLPDFYTKLEAAAKKRRPETKYSITGFEHVQTAKLASLRCGRIEDEIYELTEDEEIVEVQVRCVPFNPEINATVISKGYTADGRCKKAVIDNIYASVPSEDYYLIDAEVIDDRRSAGPAQFNR